MTSHVERLDRELQEITQPLVDHLHEVEREIEDGKRKLAELTIARRRLTAIVRGISPELAPVQSNGNGKPKAGVSMKKLEALAIWMQARAESLNEGGGFTAGHLFESGQIEHIVRARSGVSLALKALHDHGTLRLDHVGSNNAKYFKVV